MHMIPMICITLASKITTAQQHPASCAALSISRCGRITTMKRRLSQKDFGYQRAACHPRRPAGVTGVSEYVRDSVCVMCRI